MSEHDDQSNVFRLSAARPALPRDETVTDAGALVRKTRTLPTIVSPSDTVGSLSRKLQQSRTGAAIVSADGRSIDGIISERDIAYSLADRRGELHLIPVSSLMTRRVITCSRSTPLTEVARLMTEHRIRHVPVVEDRELLGVISIRDIIELRLEAIEQKNKTLLQMLAE